MLKLNYQALNEKNQEIVSETRTAMEPEFQRLRRMHGHELREMHTKFQQAEKSLRDTYEKLLQDRMAEEERAWKQSSQIRARETLDSAIYELEKLETAHKDRVRDLLRKGKEDTEAHKSNIQNQLETEKKRQKEALLRLQDDNHKQLNALKESQTKEVDNIHNENDILVQKIRMRDESAKAAFDRSVEADKKELLIECGPDKASSSSPKARDRDSVLLKERAAARDTKIQVEIRRLQAETVRIEREKRSKLHSERASITTAAERELGLRQKHCVTLENELTELASQKEELLAAITKSANDRSVILDSRLILETELSELEHRKEIADEENKRRLEQINRERKIALDAQVSMINELQSKINALEVSITSLDINNRNEIYELETAFERTLETLDRNVSNYIYLS